MPDLDRAYFSIGRLDILSYKETSVHRADPRIKVIVTAAFVFAVVSFPKYSVSGLLPFLLFPAVAAVMGDIPVSYVLKKIVVVSPFALFIGIFNPFIDRTPVVLAGSFSVSAGWFSFASILLKFVLTVSAAVVLVATTSFPGVCHALRRFGVPRVFVSQLLFLYRYMFVLMEEMMRIIRAYQVRTFEGGGVDIKAFVRLAGVLFVRTVERAEYIFQAMLARGFTGDIYGGRPAPLIFAHAAAGCAATCLMVFLRFVNVTVALGRLTERLL